MQEIYGFYEGTGQSYQKTNPNSIENCIFFNNTSDMGGNIYGYFPGDLLFKNCTFFNNSARIASVAYFEMESNYFLIFILFLFFFIAMNSSKLLTFENNTFICNYAFETAGVIFISNGSTTSLINFTNDSFIKNWMNSQKNTKYGSMLYLDNPGTIVIQFSYFSKNVGILGACIYYNEISPNSLLKLENNTFSNNSALNAGGVLFLNSKYDQLFYKNNNFYYNNSAINYAICETTNPFRIILRNNTNAITTINPFTLVKIPGFSLQTLTFDFFDYFERDYFEKEKRMIGFQEGSATLSLHDSKDLGKNLDPSIKINGISVVSIVNGHKFYKIFYNIFN